MKLSIKRDRIRVPGFKFAGVSCGLKPSGKRDLALMFSATPAVTVAGFTRNQVKAAPILYGEKVMRRGSLQAIIVNSGNANASTGKPGLTLTHQTCKAVAAAVAIPQTSVLPSSTGVIGVLPAWGKMRPGIDKAARALSPNGFWNAAEAIMTTDAFPKVATKRMMLNGKTITIAGMAKGAGMINPNMATMLCYVFTDANVDHTALQNILDYTLPYSFNAISVDGDTSTNDTLALVANGSAGNPLIRRNRAGYLALRDQIGAVLKTLARYCVQDGEGATKAVDIFVEGARSHQEAEAIARTVANSSLVKTAFFGGDPNWGRIACAVGYSPAKINQDRLSISIGDVPIGKNGMSTSKANIKKAARVMARSAFSVSIQLHLGRGRAHVLTSDLSSRYVHFNSKYTT